jgi:serpin B
LAKATSQAAVLLTTGQMAAVSTSAVALMKGVMKAMLLKRLRFVAYGIVVSAALGLVSLCYPADDAPAAQAGQLPKNGEAPRKDNESPKLNPVKGDVAVPDKGDVAVAVKGNNEFAFDLYGQLRTRDGNLFFSPNSISTALAMTYAGARGDTADEMAKALHFNLPQDKQHPAFGGLIRNLNGEGKKRGYKLNVANALWGQSGYGFKDDFLKLTRVNYGAGLREVDFAGNADGVRKEINTWVEKQTNDKIKDLIQPGAVDGSTRLVLTNAIYFKGDWNSQFKKDQTRDEMFNDGSNKKTKTAMMHQTDVFKYLDADEVLVLEMPYAGKELSMVVLLPKKTDGLPALEKSLTAEKLAGWLGKARSHEVVVSLPKFKMTSQFSLIDTLSALGMRKAFGTGADFSGIDGSGGLHISAVVHKAFVDVNEEGTEAAAATGVVMTTMMRPKPVFRADHPFVFLIRDTRNASVLFLGRIVTPAYDADPAK